MVREALGQTSQRQRLLRVIGSRLRHCSSCRCYIFGRFRDCQGRTTETRLGSREQVVSRNRQAWRRGGLYGRPACGKLVWGGQIRRIDEMSKAERQGQIHALAANCYLRMYHLHYERETGNLDMNGAMDLPAGHLLLPPMCA